MNTNAITTGTMLIAATSSNDDNNNIDNNHVDGQPYIPQAEAASCSSETASLEERVALEVKTVTPEEFLELFQQQSFSNDVHYRLEGDFSPYFPPDSPERELDLKLPRHLTVTGDLNLSECKGMRALSENLTVDGNFIICQLTELETLPEKLSVGQYLTIFFCEALLRLPDNLHVGETLVVSSCRGLRELPENRLNVGGHIFLNGCTSLSALPNWITTMGLTSSGEVRRVNISDTGLSDELYQRISNMPQPEGMQFDFDMGTGNPAHEFTTLQEGLDFWRELASTDAVTPELKLSPDQTGHLIDFLVRLTGTADYKNLATRPVLAQRIMAVMSLLADNGQFRGEALYRIQYAVTSCDDRVILTLDNLETLQLLTSAQTLAVEKHDPTELKALGRQMMILEKIKTIARAHMKTLTLVDEIEVELAFWIELGKFFGIPGSTQHMLFRGCASVNDDDIASARANIEETCTDAALETFLAQWEPWQKFQRQLAVRPFDQLKPVTVDRIDDCALLGDKTDKMVGLGSVHVDYDSLVKSYLLNGEN
uniref:NEL domain-containing protein n=1 Tax=Endozoicomonas sp. SESOKO1 TaxID=2828742 RepID=UPI0021499207